MTNTQRTKILYFSGFALWTMIAMTLGSAGNYWLRPAQVRAMTTQEQAGQAAAARRLRRLPFVEKYSESRLDLRDALGRMKRSEWNYFFLDQKNKFFAGYWEAEQGAEDLGGDPFHELLIVLEGKIYVEADGKQYVAEQGDTVIVLAGRKCRVVVKEPIKSFFVCCPVDDPLGYEQLVLERMRKQKGD